MKKKLVVLLIALFGAAAAAFAQDPVLPYQSVVRNASNRLIQDSTFLVDIEVWEGSVMKYSETRRVTSDHNGMVTFYVGKNSADRISHVYELSNVIDWSGLVVFKQRYHLYGGAFVTLNDTVHAVPYALQSGGGNSLTALENRVNTFNTNVCDSVAACIDGVNNALSQQIVRIINDTLKDGNSALNHTVDTIATNNVEKYIDTASHFTQSIINNIDTSSAVQQQIYNFVKDTITGDNNGLTQQIVKIINDTLYNGNSGLNHNIDTIVNHLIHDSIVNNIASQIHDSIAGQLTSYGIQDCDDVNNCVATGLRTESSLTNGIVDSIIDTRISKAAADSLMTQTEVKSAIHDSIVNNIASQIHDSIANSLADFDIKDCDDVNNCVATGLRTEASLTNGIVDSIIDTRISKAAADSLMTQTEVKSAIHDSIVNNIASQIHDSIANSLADFDIKDCDDVNNCVATGLRTEGSTTNNIVDSLVRKNVLDSLANGTSAMNQAIDTIISNNISSMTEITQRFTATAGQTSFTLSHTPKANFSVVMYINGVMVGDTKEVGVTSCISTSGTTATYTSVNNGNYTLKAGDRIQIRYVY